MRISPVIKVILLLLPFLEIAGFIIVGNWIGVLPTLLIIVATTILGFAILRMQGFITLMQMQRQMAAGEHPALNVLDMTLLMLGGLLLVIPGFITDIIGLLLLFPIVRKLLLHWLVKIGVIIPGSAKPKTQVHGRVIEGEFKHERKNKK